MSTTLARTALATGTIACFAGALICGGAYVHAVASEPDGPHISDHATTQPLSARTPVGRLLITRPGEQSAICTGTAVDANNILTAAHCVADKPADTTATFSPAGAPQLTCSLRVPVRHANAQPDADAIILPVTGCTDNNQPDTLEAHVSPASIARTCPTPGTVVRAYGYSGYDTNGHRTDGATLYQLDGHVISNAATAATFGNKRVVVVDSALDVGSSGGPVVTDTIKGPVIVSVISRRETQATTAVLESMSGPDLCALSRARIST